MDDPSIEAKVVDDRHIEYNGETTSLSALARELKQASHAIQGPLFFTYEGETLAARRNRIEKEK